MKFFHLSQLNPTLSALRSLQTLCRLSLSLPEAPESFFLHPYDKETEERVSRAVDTLESIRTEEPRFSGYNSEGLYSLDAQGLYEQWQSLNQAWLLKRFFGKHRIMKMVKTYSRSTERLKRSDMQDFLFHLKTLEASRRVRDEVETDLLPWMGPFWKKGVQNPEIMKKAAEWLRTFCSILPVLFVSDIESAGNVRKKLGMYATQGRDWLSAGNRNTILLETFCSSVQAFFSALDDARHAGPLDIEPESWENAPMQASFLGKILLEHHSSWPLWCNFKELRAAAVGMSLEPVVQLLESNSGFHERVESVFSQAYAFASLQYLLGTEPILQKFFGDLHEQKISSFQELDATFIYATRQYIASKIASNRPAGLYDAAPLGEIGLLRQELAKQRRHKSVRAILQGIPTILPYLKPCLLMSPLSIAQYLDASYPQFNIVIFDEASQIPVSDAIGALARGRQTIIAGDPKQLPPTAFFQKASTFVDVEEDEEELPPEDLESILDECLGAQISEHRIDWHYRSRHESLITFSNQHYYEGRLLTYPEPFADERGVQYHFVPNGKYDRGKSRTNRAEAEAIVSFVRQHYISGNGASAPSLGVITFNSEQQNLVYDLVSEAREQDLKFDEALSRWTQEECEEPFFVWNLESVQGQERDIILFSVTYGPDYSGYLTHNFGPLNRSGGERRLNVAITRARIENHVFTTLSDDQIQASKVHSVGVQHLKEYLKYAKEGARSSVHRQNVTEQSPIETFVARRLQADGYVVHRNVGCSKFRIELAVIDPARPNKYIAGILCDGEIYKGASTVRDRERLRQTILEQLGWRIIRIWSVDWYRDPQKEYNRLLERIESAPRTATPIKEVKQSVLQGMVSDLKVNPPSPLKTINDSIQYRCYKAYSEKGSIQYQSKWERPFFFEPRSEKRIVQQITNVIGLEWPIHEDLLIQRIYGLWGFSRGGSRIHDRIISLIPKSMIRSRVKNHTFYWLSGISPNTYKEFRGYSATDEDSKRPIDWIAPEEQAAAIEYVVHRYPGIGEEDTLRQVALIFGYSSLGANVENGLRIGLELHNKHGKKVE